MNAATEHAGPRVALRVPTPADRDELAELRARSWERLAPWEPRRRDEPPEPHRAWARRVAESPPAVDHRRFVVALRAGGAAIGLVTLGQIVLGPQRSACASWWIGDPHAGGGLGREAASLLLDRAFGPLGLHRIEANVATGNEPSRRLARQLGFRLEGLSLEYLEIDGAFRDHERYAILAREWLARPRHASSGPPVPVP